MTKEMLCCPWKRLGDVLKKFEFLETSLCDLVDHVETIRIFRHD